MLFELGCSDVKQLAITNMGIDCIKKSMYVCELLK